MITIFQIVRIPKTQIDEIPAPFSGQKVRLRHGRTPSEGYLQVKIMFLQTLRIS